MAAIAPIKGLILTGGMSIRMKKDKATLNYHGLTQRQHVFKLISKYCRSTFISCRKEQTSTMNDELPVIEDAFINLGPLSGILSAFQKDPDAAWLTIACDLPYLTDKTIGYLVRHRNPSKVATAFLDAAGETPEPLVTIWEPKSYGLMLHMLGDGYSSPRKMLMKSDVELLKAPAVQELMNVNYPEEYMEAAKNLQRTSFIS